MSQDKDQEDRHQDDPVLDQASESPVESENSVGRYRDEVFSKRVPAGKRTYFFDVKTTRSGEDFFITITESKRLDEGRYEKHKIFLYKEDFGKFVAAIHEVVRFIRSNCLPDYEFRGLPDIAPAAEEDAGSDSSRDDRDY